MRIAIMQPYLFPYIGYFQLINAVDKFVVYDDVTYIKQGWINRNNILVNGKKTLFTAPLVGASSNKLIYQILVANIENWSMSFYKTIEQNYKKAPFYNPTISILERSLSPAYSSISGLSVNCLKSVIEYLDINTEVIESSRIYNNQVLKSQERVIDICVKEKAHHYINAIGGTSLYSLECFVDKNIELSFINTNPIEYQQFNNLFVPWLSIIDVLMFNSPSEIRHFLHLYDLT